MAADPSFRALLGAERAERLERSPDVAFALWPDFTLAYTNPAWAQFAAANDGVAVLERWQLGSPVLEGVSEALRPRYRRAWQEVLRDGGVWQQTYECSSADTFREFMMSASSLGGGAALLVTNRQLRLHPHDPATRTRVPATERSYRDRFDLLTMCSWCRRTARPDESAQWDWVPEHVARLPERTSHGVCPLCAAIFL